MTTKTYHIRNSNVAVRIHDSIARCWDRQNEWEVDGKCNRENQVDWMHLNTICLQTNTNHVYKHAYTSWTIKK